MMPLLIAAAWVACGIASAGFDFAYFQGKYPTIAKESRLEDLGQALLLGIITGPVALVVAFCLGGFGKYGWRLR